MENLSTTQSQLLDIFNYIKPEFPKNCIFNISPSQIGNFFAYPKIWYEDNLTNNEPSFKGNTSSVLGSICHYIYRTYMEGYKPTREDINNALEAYNKQNQALELNVEAIKQDWPLVVTEVMNSYVVPNSQRGRIKVEEPVIAHIKNGIYVGGTYDRLEGDCIVDYKTVSVKPNEQSIPFNYKIQTLAYAYALRVNGYEVNRIRIVYGVRPTKTIPARCIVVTENIDFEAEKLINNTLQLIADTVITVKENPELIYLLFKSMDLK